MHDDVFQIKKLIVNNKQVFKVELKVFPKETGEMGIRGVRVRLWGQGVRGDGKLGQGRQGVSGYSRSGDTGG